MTERQQLWVLRRIMLVGRRESAHKMSLISSSASGDQRRGRGIKIAHLQAEWLHISGRDWRNLIRPLHDKLEGPQKELIQLTAELCRVDRGQWNQRGAG